jgi:hypothetical protein
VGYSQKASGSQFLKAVSIPAVPIHESVNVNPVVRAFPDVLLLLGELSGDGGRWEDLHVNGYRSVVHRGRTSKNQYCLESCGLLNLFNGLLCYTRQLVNAPACHMSPSWCRGTKVTYS